MRKWEILRTQLAFRVPSDDVERWAEMRAQGPLSVPEPERAQIQEAGTRAVLCRLDSGRWIPTSEDHLVSDLGADGWELVSVVANVSSERGNVFTDAHWLYFKRPIGIEG